MSIKKILMAAVAVSALSVGVANAATISTSSKVGMTSGYASGATLVPTTPANGPEAFSIANEVVVAAADKVYSELVIAPSSGTAIGAGQYLVTYTVSGGTFDNAVGATTDLIPTFTGTGTVNSVSVNNATTYSFVVTVDASSFIMTLPLRIPVLLGTAKAPVVVSGSIVTLAGSVAVDGGAVAPVTIVNYRDGLTFGATAASKVLTLLNGYKTFTVGVDTTLASIGTAVGFATTAGSGTTASDVVYKGFLSTDTLTTASVSTVKLTVSGDLASFDARIAASDGTTDSQGADAPTTAPGTFLAANANNLTSLKAKTATAVLRQKATPLAGNASDYTITPVVTVAAGLTAPTFAAVNLGSVSLEGTNFYAPWVGDGSNGINYLIRLGNRTAAAVPGIQVTVLNSVNAVATATCNVGTLPASRELVINSATLQTCFGAFGRADLRITAQALTTAMTAKMRSVSAGVINEQSLGGGTVNASAN
jgi:hypothetical protein